MSHSSPEAHGSRSMYRSVLPVEGELLMIISAGANLMGSDLYNHLIRYFAVHLKSLREVRTGVAILLRASVLTHSPES